jgi:DNA modification methylase
LPTLEADSVDACITDPPYGLQFMGKEWDKLWRNASDADAAFVARTDGTLTSRRRNAPDYSASDPMQMQEWHERWAREVYRVLKPGAHLLAFGGTRTFHRMTCAIEDAGFEIRDCLSWLYGQGFPKSLDVSKAIDKAAGADREIVGRSHHPRYQYKRDTPVFSVERKGYDDGTTAGTGDAGNITAPATDLAKQWAGWGTALKPSWEPIILARKPLAGTVAQTVARYGTGAINVDACRIGTDAIMSSGWTGMDARRFREGTRPDDYGGGSREQSTHQGRWPANVLLDEQAAQVLDAMTGELPQRANKAASVSLRSEASWKQASESRSNGPEYNHGGSGGASRFFFVAGSSDDDLCCHAVTADRLTDASAECSLPAGHIGGHDYSDPPTRFLYVAKPSREERGNYWSCDCETVNIDEWVYEDRKRSDQTARTSPEKVISDVTSTVDCDLFTSGCGNSDTAEYQPDSRSITSTETSKTTPSKTSDLSAPPNTSGFIPDVSGAMDNGGSHAESAEPLSLSPSRTSTSHQKAGRSTAGVASAIFGKSLKPSVCVRCGARVRSVSHPTVKPVELMRWLVRLVTPPDGIVLDPFTGSGTTGMACRYEHRRFVGIEREAEYVAIAERRIAAVAPLFGEQRA